MAAAPADVTVDVGDDSHKKKGLYDQTFGALGRAYDKFALSRFGAGIDNNKGAFFNLLFSHVIFWAVGFPAGDEFGYDDAAKDPDTGNIPSGPSGSGVFIITLVLTCVATIIFFWRAGTIWVNGRPETTEEIIRRKTTRRRDSTSALDDAKQEVAEMERKASSHDIKEAAKKAQGP
mmetsp:Transcript_25278/g.88189  ORF Transcript_25278/g.88189 Transcript_25278/m.88189 type:complete len:176 (-) Transcript_25278:209-736(-)